MSDMPIVSISGGPSDSGGWQVMLIVSSLKSEDQAQAFMLYLQKTLCGKEIEAGPGDEVPT